MQIHSWLGKIDGGAWEEATTRGRGWRWNKRQKCSLDEIFWEVDLGVWAATAESWKTKAAASNTGLGEGGGGGRAAAMGKLNPVLLWFKVWELTIDSSQKHLDGDINTQTALNPLYSSNMWAQHLATIKTPSLPKQNPPNCFSKNLFQEIYTRKRIIHCTFRWGPENRFVYRTHSSFSVNDDERRR